MLKLSRIAFKNIFRNKRRTLITFSVIADKCEGCMVCIRNCSSDAIIGSKRQPHVIDVEKCTRCGICATVCKFDAIEIN